MVCMHVPMGISVLIDGVYVMTGARLDGYDVAW